MSLQLDNARDIPSDLQVYRDRLEDYSSSFGKINFGLGGKPRLKNARDWVLNESIDISLLTSLFSSWKDFDEFLVLHKPKSFDDKEKTIAVKCAKRGNDVYGRRTEKRLRFLKQAENTVFFLPEDFDCEKVVYTRLLWVTLTWNSNLCSCRESWESAQYHYNLFITNLRNRYGRIDVLRFPQASPDKEGSAYGYHHEHLVLLFKDCKFTVFPYMDDKGVLSYRIEEKDELAAQGKWHSFIDVKAINSMNGIYNYAVKHYENAGFGDSEEATLNNAFCWLFKKKSYIVSGGFRELYAEYIRSLRNSKTDFMQIDLTGKVFCENWILIGIKSLAELRKAYPSFDFNDSWHFELPSLAWDLDTLRCKT